MASSLWKLCNTNLNLNINSSLCGSVRNGHHLRGKPPGVARSLKERLAELNQKDPKIHYRVDIGLPPIVQSRSKQLEERLKILKAQRKDPKLEKLARNKSLLIDLDAVKQEWLNSSAPHHIKESADHYGVFEHLYGDAYFYPRVPLGVYYTHNDLQHPVYYGNVIKPQEASSKPEIKYESDDKTLWTLVLTNPDGHFTEQDKEYVHWFVGNIPGNKVENGETIIQYLQPFPPKGTGYHRHVFVLYKQNKKIDFSQFKKAGPCTTLSERTFSTYEFYKNLQDDITPAGLAFFQADWDKSLKQFYHNVLEMKEPIFEYDFPEPYIKKQVWFPLRQPFNLYMDKYRDPKQINKEFLERKLKNVHPFKAPPPPLPYPNAQYFEGYVPSWLQLEKRKSRLRWGRINDIE
ncbi:39S ribosomal protein L38, mitochondrial [Aethina tumida]|uniref:39S ribosomal protein L38, mitochondrial n=1 Tax=Aethina tumida TaxID=116153 RepID=UPI002147EC77|nr:39S ribosomal protein L38, mitochondrial [Aethina tumida]XP_019871904.2 39S ribosomal protein L38, mitochondrial [Aethina tumida]